MLFEVFFVFVSFDERGQWISSGNLVFSTIPGIQNLYVLKIILTKYKTTKTLKVGLTRKRNKPSV